VEGAVAYAEDLGFAPNPDYRIAHQIFGNIDKTECECKFEFGFNGKPVYISGPKETPGDIERILKQLERRCGPGGFEFAITEVGIEELEDDFFEDDFFDEEDS
jgi:hypothetical protein